MGVKVGLVIVGLALALVAVVFVKLMNDMSSSMSEMTAHVGALSRDVSEMREGVTGMAADMGQMNATMQRIEESMRGMGLAVTRGSEQMQRWNPMELMQQAAPGRKR